MHRGIFITGTDTGVGKTFITRLLVVALRQLGIPAVGMKPFACGDRLDAETLSEANEGSVELGLVNPVWLQVPAAPYAASLIENRPLDVDSARSAFQTLTAQHPIVVVEGVGGWRVPLTDQLCMSDFAVELGLPVLVVCANRLGALNHTRLTVDAVRNRGLSIAGLVWNEPACGEPDPAQITNRAVMEHLLPGVLQPEIPYGASSIAPEFVRRIFGIEKASEERPPFPA